MPKQEYTAEFKEQAATHAQAADIMVAVRVLGLVEQTLHNWIEVSAAGKLTAPDPKPVTPEQMELSRVRRVARLMRENVIRARHKRRFKRLCLGLEVSDRGGRMASRLGPGDPVLRLRARGAAPDLRDQRDREHPHAVAQDHQDAPVLPQRRRGHQADPAGAAQHHGPPGLHDQGVARRDEPIRHRLRGHAQAGQTQHIEVFHTRSRRHFTQSYSSPVWFLKNWISQHVNQHSKGA